MKKHIYWIDETEKFYNEETLTTKDIKELENYGFVAYHNKELTDECECRDYGNIMLRCNGCLYTFKEDDMRDEYYCNDCNTGLICIECGDDETSKNYQFDWDGEENEDPICNECKGDE